MTDATVTRTATESGRRVLDLRGNDITELRFPPRSVVLIAGIPGAGKTTLLRSVYALTGRETGPVWTECGAVVLDSEYARNRWAGWLGPVPYRYWRPLVHLAHYRRLRSALAGCERRSIVVHECGTCQWAVRALARYAARHGRELHAVLLDVPVSVAEESQHRRRRRVHPRRFARHARRWLKIISGAERGRPVLPGVATVTLIDRHTASRLRGLRFHGTEEPTPRGQGVAEPE